MFLTAPSLPPPKLHGVGPQHLLAGNGRRGLGLGLSLCRSIVTAHGGTIAALDNPPHGTAFVFTLYASEVTPYE